MSQKKFLGGKKIYVQKKFGSKITLGVKKNVKQIFGPKIFVLKKIFGSEKVLGPNKNFGLKIRLGQNIMLHYCRFCGVLLVVLFLLVTRVIRTPNPLSSAKSP